MYYYNVINIYIMFCFLGLVYFFFKIIDIFKLNGENWNGRESKMLSIYIFDIFFKYERILYDFEKDFFFINV